MPQEITIANVVPACRKALADGTLLALNRAAAFDEEDGEYRCMYVTHQGFRCAIGVALNEESLCFIGDEMFDELQSATVRQLIEHGVITVPETEVSYLQVLQQEHNNWLKLGTEEARAKFLARLDIS